MMKKKRNLILSLGLAAVLCAVLYVINKDHYFSMLSSVIQKGSIYALLAVSLNLLNGFTGLFSLGQAGFMMLGAYTYAILTIPVESREAVYQYFDGGIVQFALPQLVALLLAGIVPAIFAYLIGKPVLRLKSDYLAIATLGFAEIMRAIIQWNAIGPLTNASNILKRFPKYSNIFFPIIISALCIAVIVLLINSSYGRAFKAIRDDEIAAEAMGINLARHKIISFVISSFFAGVGGALLAMFSASVQAKSFTSAMTYEILLIVVIGGIGSLTGSVLGSFLYIACSEWWLRFLDDPAPYFGNAVADALPFMRGGFRMVVFSVAIMIIVLFYRQGIMGTREFSWDAIIRFLKNPLAGFKKKSKGKAAKENV